MRSFLWFGLLLPLLSPSSYLHAQTVRGSLLDEETGSPVDAAVVTLEDERGRTISGVLTDSAGTFLIRAPEGGTYRLRAERIGYRTTTAPPIRMIAGDSIQVEFRISTSAVFLAPVTVTAVRRPWWERTAPPMMWGFYERKEHFERLGTGRFLEREQLEQFEGLPIWSLLSRMPGVRIQNSDAGQYAVLRGGLASVRPCQPEYYVDGNRMKLLQPDDPDFSRSDIIDSVIAVSLIEAIEIYTGASQLPADFGGTSGNCGVVVIWTRRS
jgi:hypothetical protein